MPRCAAFLRGINLGRRRLSNDELRAHFEALGFAGAEVFRASGNVLFEAVDAGGEVERRLEEGLLARLGYAVPTFVRTGPELEALAAFEGLPRTAGEVGKLQVELLRGAPTPAARDAVLALATADDRLAFGERALFWLPARGVGQSELPWGVIDRHLGPGTVRTMGTIEQMARSL